MAEARRAGITLAIEADNLRLRAASAPDATLLARLREHKAEIIGVLACERCVDCAAGPGLLELGGYGASWWGTVKISVCGP